MCSAFTLDSGYENGRINFIGDVHCPKKKFPVTFVCKKKTFQSTGRSNWKCRQCAYVSQLRVIPFKEQTNSLLSFGWGVYNFKESPKLVQDVNGDVYSPGKSCFNRKKCESLDGYITTPRSNYKCGKGGAWLFVHKVRFMLQENVKNTKTDKTCFFFVKKKMILLPDKQLFIIVPFESINYRTNNLGVDNKVQKKDY